MKAKPKLSFVKRNPGGNVASYWYRMGLRDSALFCRDAACYLNMLANAMTSEYDDPSMLAAQANMLERAAFDIDARATALASRKAKP